METHSDIVFEGKVWAIAEIPIELPFTNGGTDLSNELVIQHISPQRQFLLLTNSGVTFLITGIHVVSKQRPIDILQSILLESQGHDSEDLKNFFQNYSRDQACSMCLALACPSSYIGMNTPGKVHSTSPAALASHNISLWASYAFFRYGGEPKLADSFVTINKGDLGQVISGPEINYSGIHNGLVIYMSRIISPLWNFKLVDL